MPTPASPGMSSVTASSSDYLYAGTCLCRIGQLTESPSDNGRHAQWAVANAWSKSLTLS